jgi:hypothetical protein
LAIAFRANEDGTALLIRRFVLIEGSDLTVRDDGGGRGEVSNEAADAATDVEEVEGEDDETVVVGGVVVVGDGAEDTTQKPNKD